ncbi:MAG TPA: hypothetical protein PKY59_10605 [Pyrinomonadaceae bacterium]|nr:hypothetical protein [Pyrinomonadaceae bacterium]
MNKHLQFLFTYFGMAENKADVEWKKWFIEQKNKLDSGEEIDPPWICFPNSSPIHGWNQGYQEAWKNDVWVTFWNKLNNAEKENYLNRRKPPSEDWHETIMIYWH